MAKTKKYLIDTSSVRAATRDSTTAQSRHFDELTEGGALWTSTYIRMEFIRVWICQCALAAFTIAQCSTVSDALVILEQDFSPRKVKALVAMIATFLREV